MHDEEKPQPQQAESIPKRPSTLKTPLHSQIAEFVSIKYEAPLPPPGMMGQYESILPGSADRIIGMAEKQSIHRQGLENRKLDSDIDNERLGQWFGFILALIGLVGSIVLIALGKDISGLTTFIVTLTALVGVFIYGRLSQGSERSKKLNRLLEAAEKAATPSDVDLPAATKTD